MSRERLNPPGLFKHPYFTRILKVKNPGDRHLHGWTYACRRKL